MNIKNFYSNSMAHAALSQKMEAYNVQLSDNNYFEGDLYLCSSLEENSINCPQGKPYFKLYGRVYSEENKIVLYTSFICEELNDGVVFDKETYEFLFDDAHNSIYILNYLYNTPEPKYRTSISNYVNENKMALFSNHVELSFFRMAKISIDEKIDSFENNINMISKINNWTYYSKDLINDYINREISGEELITTTEIISKAAGYCKKLREDKWR